MIEKHVIDVVGILEEKDQFIWNFVDESPFELAALYFVGQRIYNVLDLDKGVLHKSQLQLYDISKGIDLSEHHFPYAAFHIINVLAIFAISLDLLHEDEIVDLLSQDIAYLIDQFIQVSLWKGRLKLETNSFQLEVLSPFLDISW